MGFRKGQRVFMSDGCAAEYIAEHNGDHIVRRVLDDGDEDGFVDYDDPRTVARIYSKPPVLAKLEELANIERTIKERAAEWEKKERELNAKLCDGERRLRQLEKWDPALSRLSMFLEGKISHFVIEEYSSIRVVTADEAINKGGNRDYTPRLLTLFRKDGDLQWRINRYSDGSGSETLAYPFTSLEDAMAFAAKRIAALLLDREKQAYGLDGAVKSAAILGIPIEQRFVDKVRADELAAAQKDADEAEKTAAAKRQKLQALLNPLPATNTKPAPAGG